MIYKKELFSMCIGFDHFSSFSVHSFSLSFFCINAYNWSFLEGTIFKSYRANNVLSKLGKILVFWISFSLEWKIISHCCMKSFWKIRWIFFVPFLHRVLKIVKLLLQGVTVNNALMTLIFSKWIWHSPELYN